MKLAALTLIKLIENKHSLVASIVCDPTEEVREAVVRTVVSGYFGRQLVFEMWICAAFVGGYQGL